MDTLLVEGGGAVRLCVTTNMDVGDPARVTVVLTHGFSMSSAVWVHQMRPDAFGAGVRVVAWDLRGHGRSARPSSREAYRDPELWAADLDAVVRATAGDSPVVLVGWSYGARVVGDFLTRHGDGLLGGVVFVGARVCDDLPGGPVTLGAGLSAKAGMLSPDRDVSDRATGEFTAGCFAVPPDAEVSAAVLDDARSVPWWVREAMDGRTVTVHEAARHCGVPVLVVHGGRDAMFPVAAAEVAAEVFGGRLAAYPDCGHAPFLEDPRRFNDDMAGFVAACTTRGGAPAL